ncbi:haloacid dehalogenase-like hydrolase [Vibrio sp. 404]|uniref:Haloacid dehalogenase-like hydrolase n=1 Tax=Vibrio marinisediminis TaxID=2758441 RepID=A0A7W2ITS9_9VIBR|nr:haloacid dehalogenase-like hydrolase [Vibrio marinisediminis]MBA5762654.1 haloacid dehalogenase-like hydrolase [Vibrio marinisediminis]
MTKRYLDCSASEIAQLQGQSLLDSLRMSEGRIVMAETIGALQPMLVSVSNAELAASQSADLLLLNLFDADQPEIKGMPETIAANDLLQQLAKFTGRSVGVNLEAVAPDFQQSHQDFWQVSAGRLATGENAQKLFAMGARFITITGNPGNGVSNEAISHSLRSIREAVGNEMVLIAGKMHAAGILRSGSEKIITQADIKEFADSGVDIVLIPAPGTIAGISQEYAASLIDYAHDLGIMAMTAIGTSQEGASVESIRQIALMSKMAGADIHHIGDTGCSIGIAAPENIREYSIAIRGVRHTYARMARSVCR